MFDDFTPEQVAAAKDVLQVLQEQAVEIVDTGVATLVNEHGFTEVQALDDIAQQLAMRCLAFYSMLPAEQQKDLADIPLLVVRPLPESD